MKGLTEHEIIRILTTQFSSQPGIPLGFDDDVSAIPLSSKTWIIVKTDMLVGSTDVPPRGLGQAAREYKCKIIGGDTNQADDLVIDIAGIGFASPKTIVRRNGARPGDIIAVTGDSAKYPSLVRAVRRPKARLTEGITLARSHAATSSIDSSDGLAWSLHQIAQSSKVGINLDTIPIAADVQRFAKEHRLSALELALYGGEEYELVVTIKPERLHDLKKHVPSLTRIGVVENESFGVVVQFDEKRIEIKERGWEHFA